MAKSDYDLREFVAEIMLLSKNKHGIMIEEVTIEELDDLLWNMGLPSKGKIKIM